MFLLIFIAIWLRRKKRVHVVNEKEQQEEKERVVEGIDRILLLYDIVVSGTMYYDVCMIRVKWIGMDLLSVMYVSTLRM